MNINRSFRPVIMLGFLLAVLLACDNGSDTSKGEPGTFHATPAQLTMGHSVYQQHCSRCHGEQAEGHPQWRKRDAQGKFPPPPLNGSGHAWHHSVEVLSNVINNGSLDGMGNMPAWKDTLTQQEVSAVIQWFQSLWPQPVYQAWYEMQQR